MRKSVRKSTRKQRKSVHKSARKQRKSVHKSARKQRKSVRKSARKQRKSVRKSARKQRKSVRKSTRKPMSYRLGISPYKSHEIRVTTMSGDTYMFYTDCKTDKVIDIKNNLAEKLAEEQKEIIPNKIMLIDISNDEIMNDEQLINRDLNLMSFIKDPLLAVFGTNDSGSIVDNDFIFLPTTRQIEAYTNAEKEIKDQEYEYDRFYGDSNAFQFRNKYNPSIKFIITSEDSRRTGYHVKNFHKDGLTWYTLKSPYDKINQSDAHQRNIYKFYENYKGENQSVTIPPSVENRQESWTYNNVNKINFVFNGVRYPIFSYLSSNGTTTYVIGIPNRNIISLDNSSQMAHEVISNFKSQLNL
jgi:hypothetical protein